ncbi:MAG: alanyl-tRNA editing protein AlaXM [Candidatus Micrarchaeota archaeon]|nr:alanyl-tRNA editing protein AlaXM [Candidatus Micrarchaeota archaeon]
MALALYLDDSYARECDANVKGVKDGKYAILDQTIFYPSSGGQPHDTGKIIRGSGGEKEEFPVIFAKKFGGEISHEVGKEGLAAGDLVHCVLDWERRYTLMRYHTASHILASIFNKRTGALITGNQIEVDKTRFDFNLENFDREIINSCIEEANSLFGQEIPIKTYYLPRSDAMKIPGIVKLAGALPPEIENLRIVEIGEIDIQADGGTHVRSLKEVGPIEIIKMENKGKSNRRVYFKFK